MDKEVSSPLEISAELSAQLDFLLVDIADLQTGDAEGIRTVGDKLRTIKEYFDLKNDLILKGSKAALEEDIRKAEERINALKSNL